MIKALILYFLSIRPTYGYNIQRFIEVNDMNQWSKIQTGSIYYALNKMEKEGWIYSLREEKTGSRIRKVYDITDLGRKKLSEILLQELKKPIMEIESDKFLIYTMFNVLDKEDIIKELNCLTVELEEKCEWWKKGKQLKSKEKILKFEEYNFDMVISNLEHQIQWHKLLLEELDEAIVSSNNVKEIIAHIDFSDMDSGDVQEKKVKELQNDIIKNPENLEEKIKMLVELLKK